MDELKRLFREKIASHLDVLIAARSALKKSDRDAVQTIHRVSFSLYCSSQYYGFPEITEVSREVIDSSENQLLENSGLLLEALQLAISQQSSSARANKILIVDDNPEVSHLLGFKLDNAHCEILTAKTGAEAQEILDQETISLAVIDLHLPDIDGRNLLVELRQNVETHHIPIIILSASTSVASKTECYSLGADEYVEKPFDLTILSASILNKLQRSAAVAYPEQLDNVTGLPNQQVFQKAFEKAQNQLTQNPVVQLTVSRLAQKYPKLYRKGDSDTIHATFSLAMVDLDYFKLLNTTWGKRTGDQVLRRISMLLQGMIGPKETLVRWELDRFLLLFPQTSSAQVFRILDKARQQMMDESFQSNQGKTFHVTFSAGITPVLESTSLDEAIKAAEQCLALSKADGRNRISINKQVNAKAFKTLYKILLAEEDELMAAFIQHRLEREGFRVTLVFNGYDAQEILKTQTFSFVILDAGLPGVDGFHLLSYVRQDLGQSLTPVLLLMAAHRESDIEKGFELGSDDYLEKPFSPVELLGRVNRLLKRGTGDLVATEVVKS